MSRLRIRLTSTACVVSALLAIPIVAPLGDPPAASAPIDDLALAKNAQHGKQFERAVDGSVVSLSWDRGDASFAIEGRVNGAWQPVAQVSGTTDEGPDTNSLEARRSHQFDAADAVSDPVIVGDADRVRVTVSSGSASNLALHVAGGLADVPEGAAGALSADATAVVMPGVHVITRAEWGADETTPLKQCPEGPQYARDLKFAVVHHTAGSGASSPEGSASVVRGIQAMHMLTNGWCDIGYNVIVDQFGQVFEGRVGGLDKNVIGAHAGGFNTSSFGISMIGNYVSARPPQAQLQSVARVLAWRLGLGGVPAVGSTTSTSAGNDIHPFGETITIPTILGHRDVGATDCPGNGGATSYPYLRFLTWLLQHGAGPASTIEWTPNVAKPAVMALTERGALQPGGAQADLGQPTFAGWPSNARDVEAAPGGGGWVLFGDGTIRSYGGAPDFTGAPYWSGFDIARDLVVSNDGSRAYVLDGYGALHPLNGSPAIYGPYWPGFDIAIKGVLIGDGNTGYVLDAYGALQSLNGAPKIYGPYWPGWRIARDVEAAPTGNGFYLLDGFGGVYTLSDAPPISLPYLGYDSAVDIEVTAKGAWMLTAAGRVLNASGSASISMATMQGVIAPRRVGLAVQ